MERKTEKTINKKEFADRMAEKGGIYKKAAMKAVDLFWETLMEYLEEDVAVNFYGIGKFESVNTNERVGRNPQNGEEILIPPRKKVRFRAGLLLKDMEEKEEK